jgi:N-acetylneuraminic acid mutarotase
MHGARYLHTATLLPDGRVIAVGGSVSLSVSLDTSETYDPATNVWTVRPSLTFARSAHTASLLPDGTVLVDGTDLVQTRETYDPASDTWSLGSDAASPRVKGSATLLPNGQLLFAGGQGVTEISDLPIPAFTATTSLAVARRNATATLLPDGKVLATGGTGGGVLKTAELFDWTTNAWTSAGTMAASRSGHTATLLPTGKVLVAGGSGVLTTELYNPTTNAWSAAGSLATARTNHSATLLANGKVLVAGGTDAVANYIANAELYDPATNTWSVAGALANPRIFHTATLLQNGKVLVTGGQSSSATLIASELYDPATNTWSAAASLNGAREWHTATLLTDGRVLVAGGAPPSSGYQTIELYDPVANTWTLTGSLALLQRWQHTATLLPDGNVLIAGGVVNNTVKTNALLYVTGANAFVTFGALSTPRHSHSATLLGNGNVLLAGGDTGGLVSPTSTNNAELFDPGFVVLAARAPTIAAATNPLAQPQSLAITGTLFTGDSESSGSGTTSSPGNYPIVQLRRIDNEAISYAAPAAGGGFTASSYTSRALSSLATGWYRITASVNGMPSAAKNILIVDSVPSNVALTSSANPVGVGQTVTFTATVTGGYVVPTGGVRFDADGSPLPGCDLSPLDASGVATCATNALTVAGSPHTILASYAGDATHGADTDSLAQVVTLAVAPVLVSAKSRKVHIGAGTFDLALSLVAPPAINHNPATEPRSGPAQALVFQFDKPVISGNAAISEGVATLGVPTFSGNEMTVPLTGVTNKQYVTVDVSSVAAADGGSGGSGSARIGLLVGNVTGSRQVLPSDVGLVRSHQLENVGPTNFQYSVTLGSKVLPADVGITRANQLQKLPTP